MRKVIGWCGAILLDITAVVIIFLMLKPFAEWYLSQTPAVGVDLFNSITYVTYHLKHFSLPWNGFKDIWFAGYPLMYDFPQLAFYFMIPAAKILGAGFGVQTTAVLGLFLFLFFSYLLFSRLSQNFGIGILLTGAVFLSANIYGALTWAGSIPSFISQMFFPLVLLCGALYLSKPEYPRLALLAFVTGMAVLVHPLEAVTFTIPSVFIIIIWSGVIHASRIKKLLSHLAGYSIGFLLSSFLFTHDQFVTLIIGKKLPPVLPISTNESVVATSETQRQISEFYRNQIQLLFSQTHEWLFILVGIGVGIFSFFWLFGREKRHRLWPLAFGFVAMYTAAHPAINFSGLLNFFRHDPYRAFWPFPVAVAAAGAAFWGVGFQIVTELATKWLKKAGIIITSGFGLSLAILSLILTFITYNGKVTTLIERISVTSEYSSAFPEALSLSFKKEETEKLKQQLTPSFMDPNDKNKRLHASDATVNIWWNSMFDMPMARGYVDPPIGTDRRGGFFWLDIATINDTLVRDFNIPEEQAYQNALFLIDWYGIYFFEGGRLGSKGPSAPPSSYLLKNEIFERSEEVTTYGALLKWQTESGKPELHMDIPQNLKFYKVKEQYTSPILSATNATAVLVVSEFSGYEDILRLLGARNLNSKKIIPVYGDSFIDAFSEGQLQRFDAVILHQYRYHNRSRAFNLLASYLKKGGKVFIDTGSEVLDAESENLPEPLPITASTRRGRGKEWDLKSMHDITSDTNVAEFAPPVFNGQEWKMTTPTSPQDVRAGSEIYLTHGQNPILIGRNVGKGKIIWSGINLPFHFNQYHSDTEAKLFEELLASLVSLKETERIPAKTEWIRPEKVRITPAESTKGILFKVQGYGGWAAKLDSTRIAQGLQVFRAGPTYPGFMYVPLSDSARQPLTVEFNYRGRLLYWFVAVVNLLTVVLLLDLIIFHGKLFGKHLDKVRLRARRHMRLWWEKEEE